MFEKELKAARARLAAQLADLEAQSTGQKIAQERNLPVTARVMQARIDRLQVGIHDTRAMVKELEGVHPDLPLKSK